MDLNVEQRMDADREEIAQIIEQALSNHPEWMPEDTMGVAREIARASIREYISRGWVRIAMHPIATIHSVSINGLEVKLL